MSKKYAILFAASMALAAPVFAGPGGEGDNSSCNGQGNPGSPCTGGNGGAGGAGGNGGAGGASSSNSSAAAGAISVASSASSAQSSSQGVGLGSGVASATVEGDEDPVAAAAPVFAGSLTSPRSRCAAIWCHPNPILQSGCGALRAAHQPASFPVCFPG